MKDSSSELRKKIENIECYLPENLKVFPATPTIGQMLGKKDIDQILELVRKDRQELLKRIESDLGLDVESFGAIPVERVQAIINALRESI